MAGQKRIKAIMPNIKAENGYLIINLLFILMLSAIMTQGIIKLSSSQLIQLNEIASHYQAKTALNLAENILQKELQESDKKIESGRIVSSIGEIKIKKIADQNYELILIDQGKRTTTKEITIQTEDIIDLKAEELNELESEQVDEISDESQETKEKDLNENEKPTEEKFFEVETIDERKFNIN